MPPFPQLAKPAASGILLAPGSPERGARPMDQQGAQVAIATFTDAEQAITAAAGPLLGYEPEPGGELAAILEALPITDCGHQRRRAQRANALDLAETLTNLTAAVEFADPPIIGRDAPVEVGQLLLQLANESPDQVAEAISTVPDDISQVLTQLGDVARDDDSVLGENPTDLIGEPGPAADEAAANTMNCLHRQLIDGLRRHEAHCRPADRFASLVGRCVGGLAIYSFSMSGNDNGGLLESQRVCGLGKSRSMPASCSNR